MTTIVILQSNYIPWRGYFDLMRRADHFVIYDEVQFTKNDWRNRNIIVTRQGPAWLTISARTGARFGQPIRETQVSDTRWAEKHWRTIAQAYARAPHIADFRQQLEDLYKRAQAFTGLSEINVMFLRALAGMAGITVNIVDSTGLAGPAGKTERLVGICKSLNADTYLSGPAAQAYLELDRFQQAGIAVEWISYPNYPAYRQNDGEYRVGVSMIDTLLMTGSAGL